MSDPRSVFVKCPAMWSYNYIGALKEFVPITPEVMEQYYTVACQYLVIRHNFVTGLMDNVQYNNAVYQLFKPFEENAYLDANVKWGCETLYRMVRPILHIHRKQVHTVTYFNDDAGDIQGLIFHYVQTQPITSLQFV